MANTTIETETELSAVNSILGAIGQSPITDLEAGKANPEVGYVYNLLRDSNIDVQNEGWHFNTEKHVQYLPDASNKIAIGSDILRIDVTAGWTHRHYDVVKRNGYLYDKYDHTDVWDGLGDSGISLDVTRLYSFENIPYPFKRYIIYRASRMAAVQLVSNGDLAKLLTVQEQQARAACMEYECNQGNHSMFGFPEDTVHYTYQPWRTLRR